MQASYQRPIEIGTSAYSRDGEKIGDIVEVQSHYFVVEKGIIFTTDLHFPMSLVTGRDDDGVRLSLTKDEIEKGDWSDLTIVNMSADGPVGYAGQHIGQAADMASATTREVETMPDEELDVDDETTRP